MKISNPAKSNASNKSDLDSNLNNNSFCVQAQIGLTQFLSRKDIGFSHLPERQEIWTAAQKLANDLRLKYKQMVIVGIGGSALGPRVIVDLFQEPTSSHKVHFCDNVDPWDFERLFKSVGNLEQVCWVFVSKSGSTIETLTSLDLISQKLMECSGLALPQHSVVVTESRANPLYNWAHAHQVPQLDIPIDVGGRFSVLSSVGLLPAAFLGVDLQELKAGAARALKNTPAVVDVMAEALASFERAEWISQFWFYSSGLKNFGSWLQQLWAESLAKKTDRAGNQAPRVSTPICQVGACDQHSVLQQVMEGFHDKWVVFTRVENLENQGPSINKSQFSEYQFMVGKKMGQLLGAEASATEQALRLQGVSTLNLFVEDLSASTLGELFMFWQLVVAGLGECLNINAFDQPGVELGKRLAKESLV